MTPRAHTRTNAFTLIEVLIATIVLGLGVLGLAALFAGAATQQQSAAAVSRSVAFSQNAIAVVGDRLGQLVSATAGDTLPAGVWDALVSDEEDGVLRSRFALFDKGDINGFGFLSRSFGTTFALQDLNPNSSHTLSVKTLDHSRIWLKEGDFRVDVNFGDPKFGASDTVTYTIANFPAADPSGLDLVLFMNDQGPPPQEVNLWKDGVVTNPPSPGDRITLRTGFPDEGLAELSGTIATPPKPTGGIWQFARLVVEDYDWFNDTLVSVNDRILTIRSESVPGGRLPVMAYSVLYRTLTIGVEATIFTYALTPLSAPRNELDEQPFIPPDTRQDFQQDRAVLREIEVELGQDQTTGQYYIVPMEGEENDWVLEGGQILVMSSKAGVVNVPVGPGAEPDRGADAPVRVMTVRTVGEERRGMLNDSPRINSRSVLEDPEQTVNIHVWAVPPIIESRSSDEGEWRLTPIEATTFKLIR